MSQKRQIFKLSILKSLLEDKNSCVSLMQSTRLLALPPFYLHDMKSGILYLLNAMLKKYDRSLGGIVMGYQNIKVLMDENTGIIPIGTSETEVNISVEFYIFQPKIGSYLEGVINKKSNDHVGCLVHQYFNATILKAEDVLYEDWVCKNLNVGDKIIFKVKDLDFTSLLPLIDGIFDGKNSVEQVKPYGNYDTTHVIVTDINKNSQNEMSVPMPFTINTIKTDGKTLKEFSDIKKCENKNKEDSYATDVNSNNNLEESQSLVDLKSAEIKKKKKKRKEEMTVSTDEPFNEKNVGDLNDKDMIVDNICKILQTESSHKKKKKKKKKKDDDDDNVAEFQIAVDNVGKKEIPVIPPSNVFGKLLVMGEKNSNDFVKVNDIKLGLNKSKYQNEEPFPNSNEINECLPSQNVEDNVLCSTQLDPALSSKKMRVSFCSPIPWRAPFERKIDARSSLPNLESSVHPYNEDNRVEKEKEMKNKHKKRKREKQEDSEDSHTAKKIKISNTSFLKEKEDATAEINSSTRKSILEIMMEQLFREQLNKSSKKASFMKEKAKKEKKNKKMKAEREESLGINEEERKSDVQSSFSKLYIQELQRVKEKLSNSNKESLLKSKKSKSKFNKQEVPKDMAGEGSYKVRNTLHVQNDGTNWSDNKLDIKSVIDKSCKQEIDRVKENTNKSDSNNIKEKKRKSLTNDKKASRKRTHLLLYDKLLNEAKSAMDLEKYQELGRPPAIEWGKREKVNEYSDLFMSSSGKKDSKKKSKRKKQKSEDCQQTYNRFKNGSMYGIAATPEKINPDKSLFSDSEQGQGSPVKTTKEVNGNETESEKCQSQNLLDEFFKEGMKRLKSESNSQSLKSLEKKRSRIEERSQISGEKEESLYDKLLRQAKSFIDGGEISPIKKKEKRKKEK